MITTGACKATEGIPSMVPWSSEHTSYDQRISRHRYSSAVRLVARLAYRLNCAINLVELAIEAHTKGVISYRTLSEQHHCPPLQISQYCWPDQVLWACRHGGAGARTSPTGGICQPCTFVLLHLTAHQTLVERIARRKNYARMWIGACLPA